MRSIARGLRRLLSLWSALPAPVRFLAPVLVMAALWLASSRTPSSTSSGPLGPYFHNLMHVVAWFVLGTAWALALRRTRLDAPGLSRRTAAVSVLLSFVYAVLDEWHQSFVPGRDSTVYDVCSDLCGSLLAVCTVHWVLTGERRAGVRAFLALAAGLLAAALATWPPFAAAAS